MQKVLNWDSTGHPEKNIPNIVRDRRRFKLLDQRKAEMIRIALHPRAVVLLSAPPVLCLTIFSISDILYNIDLIYTSQQTPFFSGMRTKLRLLLL